MSARFLYDFSRHNTSYVCFGNQKCRPFPLSYVEQQERPSRAKLRHDPLGAQTLTKTKISLFSATGNSSYSSSRHVLKVLYRVILKRQLLLLRADQGVVNFTSPWLGTGPYAF
jgi:hypothetical protein